MNWTNKEIDLNKWNENNEQIGNHSIWNTYIKMAFANCCYRIATNKTTDNSTNVPWPNHQTQIKAAFFVASIQIKYTKYSPHNVYAAAHQQK